jgi:hypothetical protein
MLCDKTGLFKMVACYFSSLVLEENRNKPAKVIKPFNKSNSNPNL